MNNHCRELNKEETDTIIERYITTCTSSDKYINAKCNIPEDIIDKFNELGLVRLITAEEFYAMRELSLKGDNTNEEQIDYDSEIAKIKKSIKFSKNSLERKQLERKLNNLYKEKKKWKITQKSTN